MQGQYPSQARDFRRFKAFLSQARDFPRFKAFLSLRVTQGSYPSQARGFLSLKSYPFNFSRSVSFTCGYDGLIRDSMGVSPYAYFGPVEVLGSNEAEVYVMVVGVS